MTHRRWMALALVAAVAAGAGCRGKSSSSGTSGSGSGTGTAPGGDGGVAATDDGGLPPTGPDEAAVRAGKRTGLGAPDERPEVATEELIRALVAGTVPWDRFVDPTMGVVELRLIGEGDAPADPFLGRRCGAELATATAALGPGMTETLGHADLDYRLVCDNSGLVVAEPGVVPHAICSVVSPADYAPGWDLVLVADATRGLRLAGFSYTGGPGGRDDLLDRFDAELGKTGTPCK